MDKKENICRLCLKFEDNAFYPLDDTSREKLEVVVPELNFKVPSTFEICCSCTESLDCAYDFKISVSENENTIHSKIADLKDDKKPNLADIISEQGEAKANGTVGSESKGVCRTCLKTCSAEDNPTNVSNEEPESLINNILRVCLADMDIEMTANPILCETCVTTLREIYSFICKSLSIEKKIKEQIESNSTDKDHLDNVLTVIKEELGKSNNDFFSEFEIQDEDGPDNVDGLTFVDENDKKKRKAIDSEMEPPGKKRLLNSGAEKSDESLECAELPSFDPEKQANVEEWISKVEEMLKREQWTDEKAIEVAISKLKGLAYISMWFTRDESYTWKQWKNVLMNKFPVNKDYFDTLKKMVTTVKSRNENYLSYYYKKLALLHSLDITGEKAVSCLIGGIYDISIKSKAKSGNFKTPEEILVFFKLCDENTKCFSCGQTGHLAAECPKGKDKPKATKRCFGCQGLGHELKDCKKKSAKKGETKSKSSEKDRTPSSKKCYGCGEFGHTTTECRIGRDYLKSSKKCHKCNDYGHLPADCRAHETRFSDRKCFTCKEFGHEAINCPKKPRSVKVRKCFKCNELGHEAADCRRPKVKPKTCFLCKEPGHEAVKCPRKFTSAQRKCFSCNEIGHEAIDCVKNKFKPKPKSEMRCYACNEYGHQAADCPLPTEMKEYLRVNRKCFNCNKSGHEAINCPMPKVEGERFVPKTSRKCFLCNDYGHMASACPRRDSPSGMSTWNCNKCKKMGHQAENCPNVKCHDCLGYGHEAKECPKSLCGRCGEAGHHARFCMRGERYSPY